MSETQTQELTKVGSTALAAAIDMSSDAGAGLEYIDPTQLSMPFISIVQGNSPQTKKSNEKFIPGAIPGHIFNTLTGAVFDGTAGIHVIICSIQKRDLEWLPRDESLGRPVFSYPFGDPETPKFKIVEKDNGKKVRETEGGNYLAETDELYVLRIDPAGFGEQAIIALDSADLGCSRKLTSQIFNRVIKQGNTAFKAPIYGQVYRLSVIEAHNDQYDWFKWKAEFAGLVDDAGLYAQAKAFNELVEPRQTQVIQTSTIATVEKKEITF